MQEEQIREEEGMSLKDIFKIFKTHWIAILVATIVGAGVGLGYSLLKPAQYQASMKVYIMNSSDIGSTGESGEIVNSLRVINTFKSFISESAVAKKTVEKLSAVWERDIEPDYYTYVMNGLSVSVDGENTLCVNVLYTHTNAKTAKEILENIILAAKDVSGNSDFDLFKGRINTVYPASMLGKGDCADVKVASKGKTFYLAIGLVGGLVVGLAYAFIRELLDNTIKDKKYIENKYGVKVIGSIPEQSEEEKDETNKQ